MEKPEAVNESIHHARIKRNVTTHTVAHAVSQRVRNIHSGVTRVILFV